MSSLLGGRLISPTSGSSVVSVSYTRRKDLANLKVDVMRISFLVMHQTPNLKVVEICDVEFDESNGSQGKVVGYDHVGNEEVQEALKNMSIEDIKP
jgi:hypothetical protein